MVGNCLVPEEELVSIQNFAVKTMLQREEDMWGGGGGGGEGYRIPDYSILICEIMIDGVD